MTVSPQANPGAAASESRLWTYDELVATFPESNQPCELWDGEIVMSPSPSYFHQKIVDRFHDALKAWVRPRNLGETVAAPMDMVLTQDTVTQPDVLFIAAHRLQIIQDRVRGAADLVVEVISAGSRRRDRIDKRDLYEQHGIREYWIIDPAAKSVEVLVLQDQQYKLAGRWRSGETAASRLLDGFTVVVDFLFSES